MAGYLLKAPDEQMGRWRAAAARAGVSLAEFLRDAADAADLESAPLPTKPPPPKPANPVRPTRKETGRGG